MRTERFYTEGDAKCFMRNGLMKEQILWYIRREIYKRERERKREYLRKPITLGTFTFYAGFWNFIHVYSAKKEQCTFRMFCSNHSLIQFLEYVLIMHFSGTPWNLVKMYKLMIIWAFIFYTVHKSNLLILFLKH